MPTGKYDHRLDELASFMKSAGLSVTELNSAIALGLARLNWGINEWKNVDKKPSFPPSPPPAQTKPPYTYEEKNFYVNASNNLWYQTFWPFYLSLNEIYFELLLDRIKQFEDHEEFLFNKGVVYGNLGVAQAAQRKLESSTWSSIGCRL